MKDNHCDSLRSQGRFWQREKISRSLNSISLALLVCAVFAFVAAGVLARKMGSIYSHRNWQPGITMMLLLLTSSVLFAAASLIKPNMRAAVIIIANAIFYIIAVLYYVRVTD
jgi:hypothetical protein